MRTHQIILVKRQESAIVEVRLGVLAPKDSEVIDLSNEWHVMPVALTWTRIPIATWGAQHFKDLDYSYVTEGTGLRALQGLHTAQILLNAGITTVRDVGNDANFAAVDLQRRSMQDGSRDLQF